jgi:hypothetical protein
MGGKCDRIRGECKREGNTGVKDKITKRKEIWAYEMESGEEWVGKRERTREGDRREGKDRKKKRTRGKLMSEGGLQEKYETDWCKKRCQRWRKKLMKGKRNVVAVGLFIGSQF